MRIALVLSLALALALAHVLATGCYQSYRIVTDDDSDSDGPDAVGEECPDRIPAGGLTRCTLTWRRRAASDWASSGSGGLTVIDGVVVAVVPRPAPSGPGSPRLVRLAADTGEPLADLPEAVDLFPGAAAVDAGLDGGAAILVVEMPNSSGATRYIGYAWIHPSSVPDDATLVPAYLDGVAVRELRARLSGDRAYVVTEGRSASEWALHGVTLPLAGGDIDVRRLLAGPTDAGEGSVAVSEDGAVVAWTFPSGIRFRTPAGSVIGDAVLEPRSTRTPVAAGLGGGGTPFVVAGRDDTGDPTAMWTRSYRAEDPGVPSEVRYDAFEAAVGSPGPRAIAPGTGGFALAWTARRALAGGHASSCLYFVPIDPSGAAVSAATRLDPGFEEAGTAGIEHVRLTVAGGSAAVLMWRHDPDLWIARVDCAS